MGGREPPRKRWIADPDRSSLRTAKRTIHHLASSTSTPRTSMPSVRMMPRSTNCSARSAPNPKPQKMARYLSPGHGPARRRSHQFPPSPSSTAHSYVSDRGLQGPADCPRFCAAGNPCRWRDQHPGSCWCGIRGCPTCDTCPLQADPSASGVHQDEVQLSRLTHVPKSGAYMQDVGCASGGRRWP